VPSGPNAPAGSESGGQEQPEPGFNPGGLPAGFGSAPPKKRAGSSPAPLRVLPDREFVITIDCYADHATVFPGGKQFRWTAQNQQGTDQALALMVQHLIERRQASVRPGDPPYRPRVHYQVPPSGRVTFDRVWPLLNFLHIPMTRENVED
jgi:hypothetical protein